MVQPDGVGDRPLEAPANLGHAPPDFIAPDVRRLTEAQGYFTYDDREYRSGRPLRERMSAPSGYKGTLTDLRREQFCSALTGFGHTLSIRDATTSGSWRPWPSSGQWRPYPGIRTEWTVEIEPGFVRSVRLEKLEYYASGDDDEAAHVGFFVRYEVIDPRLSTAPGGISLRLVKRKASPFVGRVVGVYWKGKDGDLGLLAGLNGDSRTTRPVLAGEGMRIITDRGRGCWMWRTKGWSPPSRDRWDAYQLIARRLLAAPIPISDET